jgi:hypothetical protein
MRQPTDFLQNGQELWRWREAQSSIRIQEGEPLLKWLTPRLFSAFIQIYLGLR